jgi:transcriptional antiterminator RfaH
MAYWSVAQLQFQRTTLALQELTRAGYEIYHPRLRQQRISHGRKVIRTPRLFPGYAFVLVVSGWWNARWAPGVIRIVLDGGVPAKVPDAVIAELRAREKNGLVELPRRSGFKPGDKVRVLHGPLVGQLGLFAGMKGSERILILLSMLGSLQRVELAKDSIEAAR